MKQIFTLLISVLIINTLLFAKQIDEKTAIDAAQKYLQLNFPSTLKSGSALSLVYKCTSKQTSTFKSANAGAYYYVFNSGDSGFIIVAGDDASLPILGYSTESNFDPNKIPQTVAKWLEGYKEQIRFISENKIEADETIKSEWNKILSGQPNLKSTQNSVAPLIQTKWDQSPYFNDKCPIDYNFNEKAVTGCVATAMAQVLRFWKYPQKGYGFHSYKHSNYGTLSANFSSTYYDWNNMPNIINSANDAVATLMYHCGVSIDMNYNVSALGGSGAYTLDVANALKEFFGYSSSVKGVSRKDYSDNSWIQLLKAELDNGRPIQYAGSGTGGGHSFVCDGYDSNGYFHFNWGWGSVNNSNGNFLINGLNPGALGTGGGSGGFNTDQKAIIGIKPPDASQSYDMKIYKDVVSSKSTINYGDEFTITTDILNDGKNAFTGDFCAAAFDENNTFTDFIETKTNWSLGPNYHYSSGISFATEGLLTLLPGTYKVFIFYRPTGGNWIGMKSGLLDLFTNDYTTIKVTNANKFQLYASIITTPNKNIYKGQPLSVWVDVANFSTGKFTGAIDVSLFTLDGKSATSIEIKTGLSLDINTHYLNGLTFTTNNINVAPGTYLLAVSHKPDGNDWQLTGSTVNYLNPVMIIIQEQPIQPDIYENNDAIVKAYDLKPSFSGNVAERKTTGSSIHVGTDYDYYKFSLNSGYNYSIKARLQDAYSNTDGQTYSMDGLFSYSTDGVNWSDAFDDILSNDISVKGANTIYFWVSPYFTGETGTYQLDLSITRTPATATSNISDISDIINVYPNPASDFVIVDMNNYQNSIVSINISDMMGRAVYADKNIISKQISVPLSNIKSGMYVLTIVDDSGNRISKKLIIEK